MYLAVRFYKDVPNRPAGIPDNWPSDVIELGDQPYMPENLDASDGWVVMESYDLDAVKAQYQKDFDAWYSKYMAVTPQQAALQKVKAATIFGQQLVQQIEADNIVAGLTTQQVGMMLRDYSAMIAMLQSGSLITALAAASSLQPVDGMTQERIDGYIEEIEEYLGMST